MRLLLSMKQKFPAPERAMSVIMSSAKSLPIPNVEMLAPAPLISSASAAKSDRVCRRCENQTWCKESLLQHLEALVSLAVAEQEDPLGHVALLTQRGNGRSAAALAELEDGVAGKWRAEKGKKRSSSVITL
jgi:hypothetical protein